MGRLNPPPVEQLPPLGFGVILEADAEEARRRVGGGAIGLVVERGGRQLSQSARQRDQVGLFAEIGMRRSAQRIYAGRVFDSARTEL